MRLLNLIVAAALVLAAGYVYKTKYAATVEAERVAKLRMEIARERETAARLRAEAANLENPARVQGLADRHLALRPLDLSQIDSIDEIPFRPGDGDAARPNEPVAARIPAAPADPVTGSVRPQPTAR